MTHSEELAMVEKRWEDALERCMDERADAWAEIGRQRETIKRLEAENAKLREQNANLNAALLKYGKNLLRN